MALKWNWLKLAKTSLVSISHTNMSMHFALPAWAIYPVAAILLLGWSANDTISSSCLLKNCYCWVFGSTSIPKAAETKTTLFLSVQPNISLHSSSM